jgi:hypothetical protein
MSLFAKMIRNSIKKHLSYFAAGANKKTTIKKVIKTFKSKKMVFLYYC